MIEANGLTATGSKAQLHVFDILTGFVGSVGTQTSNGTTPLTYIDKTIGYVGSAWPFVDADGDAETPAYYRWTKTGTHTFFGYLTKDPAGNSLPEGTVAMGTDKKLTVGPLTMAASDTPQVDFLYSDIITRNAATDSHAPIPLSMSHLFTALQVQVSNQTGDALSDFGLKFLGFVNGVTATVDYTGTAAGDPQYTGGSTADFPFGEVTALAVNQTAFTSLYASDPYRLLWPQTVTANTKVEISYKVSVAVGEETKVISNTISANLLDIFQTTVTDSETGDTSESAVNALEAGHKYLLKITIKPTEVLFKVLVDPLDEKYYDNNHSDYLIKL